LLDQYILLVYEDEFINKYNSIDKGYNIERTLEKVLAGKHKICKNSDIDIPILSKVLKNIEENNGKFIVDTSKATEKICCIEQDFICKDYKEANEIYKPYTSESILNACTSGGGKVKLRTGKTLHFIYESDYATTGAKVSDIKNIKEGVKISIPATLEYSYPDFIDTSYPLNLKDFIRLLDTQNKYLLIPYTRLCAILRKNLIFEYTFTGKNKVTNKYLKLGYFIQTVTMTSGRSKYSKIKVTPIGCKFLYKLLETNKLINV
jgi:phage antirepressor YoqD-like protein